MGGFVDSVVSSASNAVNNTVGSVTDFVKAPAATVSGAFMQQRDQGMKYSIDHAVQDFNLVTGKSNVGTWFDNQSMADTNASMAVGTGTGTNSGARGIRNTAAVLGAVYGGAAAYGAASGTGAGAGAGAGMTQAEMLAAQEAGLNGGLMSSLGGFGSATASNVLKSLGTNYVKSLINPAPWQTQAEMLAQQDAGLLPVAGATSNKTALIVAGVGVSLLLLTVIMARK